LIEQLHKLANIQFLILYIDPRDNDLLPINNDDNFGRALKTARPLLRVIVQRKGWYISSGLHPGEKAFCVVYVSTQKLELKRAF